MSARLVTSYWLLMLMLMRLLGSSMRSSEPLLHSIYGHTDSGQALESPEERTINARIRPEMIPFHRLEAALGRNLIPCPDSADRAQRFAQIMLDVVHVLYPFDLVPDVKGKRHIPDAAHAKAACRIQDHEQQVVEMSGTDTTVSKIELRKVPRGKHEAIETVGHGTRCGIHFGQLLHLSESPIDVAAIDDERDRVAETVHYQVAQSGIKMRLQRDIHVRKNK